jgi:TonB family protein
VPDFLLLPPTPTPGAVRGKTVVVRLAIDASGLVRDVELLQTSGDRSFDQALRRTALGWRFRPALDPSNRPVAVTYDITFNF